MARTSKTLRLPSTDIRTEVLTVDLTRPKRVAVDKNNKWILVFLSYSRANGLFLLYALLSRCHCCQTRVSQICLSADAVYTLINVKFLFVLSPCVRPANCITRQAVIVNAVSRSSWPAGGRANIINTSTWWRCGRSSYVSDAARVYTQYLQVIIWTIFQHVPRHFTLTYPNRIVARCLSLFPSVREGRVAIAVYRTY